LSKNEFDYKTLYGPGDRWGSSKKVEDWFPRDIPQNFTVLPQEHQDYWNDRPFKYYLNDWGHRCEDIDVNANNIVFIGCSLTFGTGLPKEQTWPYLVSKELGMREVNLGAPGGSLDTCFRLYNAWQYEIKAPITVLMIPPGKRVEFDDYKRYIRYGHWSPGLLNSDEVDKFIIKYILDDKPYKTIHDKNIAAINWIAHETNSSLHIVNSETALSDYATEDDVWQKQFPVARDGNHPGPLWHKWVAKHIIQEINNEKSTIP